MPKKQGLHVFFLKFGSGFRNKRNILLGLVFFLGQLSANEFLLFEKKFLYPIEVIDFLNSNTKYNISPRDQFMQSSGSLKIANLAVHWTNLCTFYSNC